MTRLRLPLLLLSLLLGCFPSGAVLAGQSATLQWSTNTEADFDKTTIYRGPTPCGPPDSLSFLAEVLKQSGTTSTYQDNTIPDSWPGVCYTGDSLDKAKNRSVRAAVVSKFFPVQLPALTLTAGAITTSSIAVSFPIPNGAKVDVRIGRPDALWGDLVSVCTGLPCNITNLVEDTAYQVRGVYYTGTADVDAKFGPLGDALQVRTLDLTAPEPPRLKVLSESPDGQSITIGIVQP